VVKVAGFESLLNPVIAFMDALDGLLMASTRAPLPIWKSAGHITKVLESDFFTLGGFALVRFASA
jgi:hypothetical protein